MRSRSSLKNYRSTSSMGICVLSSRHRQLLRQLKITHQIYNNSYDGLLPFVSSTQGLSTVQPPECVILGFGPSGLPFHESKFLLNVCPSHFHAWTLNKVNSIRTAIGRLYLLHVVEVLDVLYNVSCWHHHLVWFGL